MFITSVLLDDEPAATDTLLYELQRHCPNVHIKAVFNDTAMATNYIKNNTIDVLFLDINMPGCTGFEFLAQFTEINFSVIFVTAHEQYAIKAFDFYAVAYLLKPVEPAKLIQAVNRLQEKNQNSTTLAIFEQMFKNLAHANKRLETLAIPTIDGFEIIEVNNIFYLQAEGNYTEIVFKNHKMVVSKNLGDFEKILAENQFVRIHNSFMINIKEVRKYTRGDGGTVSMSNGSHLPVSRSYKHKVIDSLHVS